MADLQDTTGAAKARASLQDARRVVVKVGTHAIASPSGRPDHQALGGIVSQLCRLRKAGVEVVYVSSGAVAAGIEALGLEGRPELLSDVQMCAAVGQARFIFEYERLFAEHGVKIGQVLLTHADFADSRRAANIRRSLDHLLKAGIVPVVNENDVVADDEIKGLAFGDNDWLSALITRLVRADALILLTTVDGLLDRDGRRLGEMPSAADAARLVKAGEKGRLSKGGMDSKLRAVGYAAESGANVVIANGRAPDVILDAIAGRDVGTLFPFRAV